MSLSEQRLQQIDRQQADDYWVLVRHVVCSTYLGMHVVPVPYLEDAEHYNLLNVLLEKSEKAHSHLLQRKSFFPLGPLQKILVNIDSRTFETMEKQVKRQTQYTKDFDYEELVIDEGSLKSVKLIAKDINKEVSLFFLKPRLLRVSDTLPWICSVRSIYIICEVYTTNIQLLVTDSKLIQQYKPDGRIPIAFLCRKFKLESTGLIGAELAMRRSPKNANFVNSSSTVYRRVVVQDESKATGTPARCRDARRFFQSILPECCLSRSHGHVKSRESAQAGSTTSVLGSIRADPSTSAEEDASDGGYSQKTASSRSISNTPSPKSGRSPWISLSSPLLKNVTRLISQPHNAERNKPIRDKDTLQLPARGRSSRPPLREPGTETTPQTFGTPAKVAEATAASPSIVGSRKAVRSASSPSSLQEVPGTYALPQSVGEPFVQQTFKETAPSSDAIAECPLVLHNTVDFIHLPQSVAEPLLVQQTAAESAPSSDSIAENPRVPHTAVEFIKLPQSVAEPLLVQQTAAESAPSSDSIAENPRVPHTAVEFIELPQPVAEPLLVQQTAAESAPSSDSIAENPRVPHTAVEFIKLPQSVAEPLLVQQTAAESAPSFDSIAENPLTPQAPAGSTVPQRPVAACLANAAAGGRPPPSARPSSSSSSSSSGSSRLCPSEPRYREHGTDSSALILTIQDLINTLRAIVLSGPPPSCSSISPPAARHPRLDQTYAAMWARERREPSPPPAPGTRRTLEMPTSSISTELGLRLPSSSLSAPLREAAVSPPSTLWETTRPNSSLSVPSSNSHKEKDQLSSHFLASLYDPPEEATRPRDSPPITLREAIRPPAYQLTPLVPQQTRCRTPVTLSDSEGEEIPPLIQSAPGRPPSDPERCPCCGSAPGLRAAACPYELEWERHWAAAATPKLGADSLRHKVPNSEAEGRAGRSGR